MLSVSSREALRSLLGSKQRTILALLGVIIGIGSVMAMLSVGETVKAKALNQFRLMGTDILVVRPGFSSDGEQPLSLAQVEQIARYSRYIRRVSPEVNAWGKVLAQGQEFSPNIMGVQPVFKDVKRLVTTKGRFLTYFDQGRPHAVLGNKVSEEIKQRVPSQEVTEVYIGGMPFRVVGELAPANLGMQSDMVDRGLYIPLAMAQRISGQEGISAATVQLWPEADHDAATAEIKEMLTRFGKKPGSVDVDSPKRLLEQVAQQMRLYTLLLAAVGSISLVVGGVGIMNMMLVSVTERRREIGIRRALGAQRGDIISQFLVESVILSLAGGVIGVALGAAAGVVVAQVQNAPPVIPVGAVFLCLGVALVVGLFFGYYPARKAAHLDVIQALKAD